MEEWRREKYYKSLARIIFHNLLMGVQEEQDLIYNDHIITLLKIKPYCAFREMLECLLAGSVSGELVDRPVSGLAKNFLVFNSILALLLCI